MKIEKIIATDHIAKIMSKIDQNFLSNNFLILNIAINKIGIKIKSEIITLEKKPENLKNSITGKSRK